MPGLTLRALFLRRLTLRLVGEENGQTDETPGGNICDPGIIGSFGINVQSSDGNFGKGGIEDVPYNLFLPAPPAVT